MADIISDLASQCGVSAEQAQKGLGAVLEMFKKELPAETYSKVQAAVPGAEDMVAQAEQTAPEASGGLLGNITSAIGKLFGGGGGVQAMVAKLGQLGFSADQLKAFVPKVLEFLKGKLPADVTKQAAGLLGTPEEVVHS
jgi:hypothetical protein